VSDIAAGRLSAEDYARNFDDLTPPLDGVTAPVEAARCYFCYDAPCIEACPTGIDIPSFIRKIQTGNVKGSALTILDANIMGGACARVCPTEVLCEDACVRNKGENKPVKIGRLQRYATDWLFDAGIQPFARAPATGKRVAVVGAGPAGLACAHALARLGHAITVFEKRAKAGGLNEYGIAAYKVAHDFAQREVAFIQAVGGIDIRYGQALGDQLTLAGLRAEFDAVFIGIGLGGVNGLGIDGQELGGVEDAVRFIETLRQSAKATVPVGRHVVVIGGGNTAIDASVQSKRLGAETVTLVYRRGPEAMSATAHEQEVAKGNGVTIRYWAMPTRLVGANGNLSAVEFAYSRLDEAGRLIPTNDGFCLAADQCLVAIGQKLDAADLAGALALANGKIAVDDDYRTSLPGVWAGGDATAGDDLTVVAVEDGKIAARSIHAFLQG